MSYVARPGVQQHAQDAPRVIVAGATGFAGALAAHLLWRHPHFELVAVTGRSEVGRQLGELYPRYRVPMAIEQLEGADLDGVDAAVVAYPHAAAAPTVGALRERAIRVVDLSADFRLRSADTYARWYGEHPRTDLLAEAVYGLTELHRERIAGAGIVANPGCYPTASLLALAPLARAGLIADLVIDAKQGISGAGRVFDHTTHLSMAGENIVPYKVAAHRHTPEIEEQLGELHRPGRGIPPAPPTRRCGCSSRRTSCRSTRVRWRAATSPPPASSTMASCASYMPARTTRSRSSRSWTPLPACSRCARPTTAACSPPPTPTPAK